MAEKNVIVPNCQNSQVNSTPTRNRGIKKYILPYKPPTVEDDPIGNNIPRHPGPEEQFLGKGTDPDENIGTIKFRIPESESLAETNVIASSCQNSQVSSTPLRNHGIHIQDSRERACKLSVSVKGVPITDMKSFLAQKKMEREKKFKSKVPVPGAPLPKGKKKN